MLSREGRQYMEIAPRLAVWPGLCLTVVVYCLNMVGDGVRDLLDPRLRGGAAGSAPRAPRRSEKPGRLHSPRGSGSRSGRSRARQRPMQALMMPYRREIAASAAAS